MWVVVVGAFVVSLVLSLGNLKYWSIAHECMGGTIWLFPSRPCQFRSVHGTKFQGGVISSPLSSFLPPTETEHSLTYSHLALFMLGGKNNVSLRPPLPS